MTAAVIDRRGAVAAYRPAVRPTQARRAALRRRRQIFMIRRLLVLLVVLAMGLGIASLWALRSEASSEPAVAATVVVGPGDTVWDIAHEYVPAGVHPQAYVAAVLRHNDLDAGALAPGMVLELPR